MADSTITTRLEVEDGVSAPVKTGTNAVKELRAEMSKAGTSTDAYTSKTKTMGAASAASSSKAKTGLDGLTESTKKTAKAADMQKLSIGNMGDQWKTGLMETGPMVSESTLAMASLGVAFAAAAAAATAFAFSIADGKRSQMLNLEAMLKSADAAKVLDDAISDLAGRTPVTEDRLEDMSKSLVKAGLRGDALTSALETLAMAEGATGDAATSSALEGMIAKSQAVGKFTVGTKQLVAAGLTMDQVMQGIAAKTGQSMEQVQAAYKAGQIGVAEGVAGLQEAAKSNWGDVTSRQMMGMSVQLEKTKTAFLNMFEGVNIEPFLQGLQSLTSLFTGNTATSRALGSVIQTIFGGIASVLGFLLPLVRAFIVGFTIGFLKIKIAIKPVTDEIGKLFGSASGGDTLTKVFMFLGEAIAFVAAAAVMMTQPIFAIIGALAMLKTTVTQVWNSMMEFAASFFSVGAAIIDGIVGGITSGVGKVVDTIKSLGSSALAAMGVSIDAHSPSRKFAKVGGYMPAGVVEGVEGGTDAVNQAIGSMVTLPSASSVQGGGGSVGGGGGGTSVSAGGITIQIYGVAGAEQLTEVLPKLLAQAFEEIGLSMGTA